MGDNTAYVPQNKVMDYKITGVYDYVYRKIW